MCCTMCGNFVNAVGMYSGDADDDDDDNNGLF